MRDLPNYRRCKKGRSPRSPQSYKYDTMGVELGLNCPDRSWCRTTSSDTKESGDTGRENSRDGLQEEHLKRERKKLLERNG